MRSDKVTRLCKLSRSWKLSRCSLTISANLGDIASENRTAIQLIQNLFKLNEQKNNSQCRNIYIVDDALRIYNETKQELKNYALINSLLKIFCHFKQPEKISTVWNEIDCLAKGNHAISYPNIFDCCIKQNPININDAIQCLEWMKSQNYHGLYLEEMQLFSKNTSKLIAACSIGNNNIQQLKYIHSLIDDIATDDIYIKTALINAYGICATTPQFSFNVFQSINDNQKNNVVIGAMMKVFIQHNKYDKVLRLYNKYNPLLLVDDISNVLAIKSCILSNNFDKGNEIINHYNNMTCTTKAGGNTRIKNVLIDFYSYFGDLTKAAHIFNHYNGQTKQMKDVTSVCSLMKGYVNNNDYQQALQLYDDNITLTDDICHVLALKTCIAMNNFKKAQEIEQSLSSNHGIVCKTTLIDMYSHFGCIEIAQNIFETILIEKMEMDIVAINAMMTAYIANNMYDKALTLYGKYDHLLNDTSHILGVKACTLHNNVMRGKQIHSYVKFTKYYTLNLQNTLIDFYGTCKDVNSALQIFNSIPNQDKDIITINAMMKAYCNDDFNTQCLQLFNNLSNINDKLTYDVITFSTALKACIQSTDFYSGQYIHNILKHEEKYQHLLHENMIQINLINMYGKSGILHECKQIFDDCINQNNNDCLNKYNALMNCYGRNGDIQNVEKQFEEMILNNITPDAKTYKILINSFSHGGYRYAQQAQDIWLHQICNDNIKYDPFVVSTLINCFSRNGMISEGYQLLLQYENKCNESNNNDVIIMWTSLLSGCKKYNDQNMAIKINKEMQEKIMKLSDNDNTNDTCNTNDHDETMGTASVLMANIFGSSSDFEKVNEIRAEMKRRGWKKKPGFSETDVYGTLHRFYAGWGYRRQVEYKIIDKKLKDISERMEEFGYARDYSAITRQLKDWETPNAVLNRHGEKLAVIYALLTTQPDYLIVVNKNLRICVDCHNWMKMVSKIEQRKLIIADNNRVHTFENGKCTCNDYW